jgi:hypothetical protein
MKDITNIDWKGDITKIVEGDPAKIAKQKVFFLQNGVEYDGAGKACNAKQVDEYYNRVAAEAQKLADDAAQAAKDAKASAAEARKMAGTTTAAARS